MRSPTTDKKKATSIQRLEQLLEQLMLEVSQSHPAMRKALYVETLVTDDMLKTWAHMTAMYVSECVKRKDSDPKTIRKNATKAVKRRIEKELADSYLNMEIPKYEAGRDDTEEPGGPARDDAGLRDDAAGS